MGKYYAIHMPDHHLANSSGSVYIHILEAEKKLQRPLKNGESVHHKDFNKLNNSPNNLMVFKTVNDHSAYHQGCKAILDGDVYICPDRIDHNKKPCPICGKMICYKSTLCIECEKQHQRELSKEGVLSKTKISKLSRKQLKDLVRNLSFEEIGRMFECSGNAVKNRCDLFGIPRLKSEIKNISDENWDNI